ncbi:MAG: hypothetical protein JW830_13470 [Bacteroidales bacterium]|nr:hypothetical protein [Bacteroidales bacterium]
MKTATKKSIKAGMRGLALSFITVFVSFILIFLIAALLDFLGMKNEDTVSNIAYICYDIVIAIVCFLMCRKDPSRVWYAPIVCNAVGIIAAFAEPTFWKSEMWIIFGGGWVLSLVAALCGVMVARHIKNINEMRTTSFNVFAKVLFLIIASFTGCTRMSEQIPDSSAGMNGSFEYTQSGLPVNWLLYTPNTVPSGDFDIIIDTIAPQNGKQSLKFMVRDCLPTGGWHSPGFCNQYGAMPDETYRVSFWVKNEGCRFLIRIGGVSATQVIYDTIVNSQATIESWELFEHDYTVPQGMAAIRIEANILQPGTFWVDDLRIDIVNE